MAEKITLKYKGAFELNGLIELIEARHPHNLLVNLLKIDLLEKLRKIKLKILDKNPNLDPSCPDYDPTVRLSSLKTLKGKMDISVPEFYAIFLTADFAKEEGRRYYDAKLGNKIQRFICQKN